MTESYELYRKDSPSTSIEAAESIEPNKLESLVLNAITTFRNGCISDQVIKYMAQVHGIDRYSTVTARYAALYRKGLINYTGEKRKGESGRNQRVMITAERQGRLL
tara:strand:+ start:310 stop:627 length:318 start_codon:yes stop_codon:yes gene_type:complete